MPNQRLMPPIRTRASGLRGAPWLAALAVLLAVGTAQADLADPGPYQAGWSQVTVPRPGGGTFTAVLFYPATATGQGAPYAGSGAPYPAITFGHGWLTPVNRYQSTLAHLATWGYFVVASESQGGLFPSHSDFADDLRWCLSYLEVQSADPVSWLHQQVRTGAFGAAGHSMGGGASILATERDSRIRALANLAAAETNPSAIAAIAAVQVPVCLVTGSADSIVPPSGHTIPMYDHAPAPRRLPLLAGGWHCGFLDSSFFGCDSGPLPRATQLALTRRLLTGWFQLYLKADQGVWQEVWGPKLAAEPLIDNTRADAGVRFDPNEATVHGYGGQVVEREFLLTQTGPRPTSYSLFIEENAWPATPTPAQTPVLAPGQTIAVRVTAAIPTGAGAASDLALLSARSDLDGGTRGFARLTVQRHRNGDINGDGSVDAQDFALLAACLAGPATAVPAGCADADLDLDSDVDLVDLGVLQREVGAGR